MTRNTHGIKGATHAGRCQGRCRDFEIRRCSGPGIPKSAAAAFRKTCNCEWDSQLRGLAKSRFAIAKSGNASAWVPCALDFAGISHAPPRLRFGAASVAELRESKCFREQGPCKRLAEIAIADLRTGCSAPGQTDHPGGEADRPPKSRLRQGKGRGKPVAGLIRAGQGQRSLATVQPVQSVQCVFCAGSQQFVQLFSCSVFLAGSHQ